MSKRDYRKFLIAKEKHKAELTEKVRISQERVWNCDIDKYNENKLRGAIVQDLHNICNSSRCGCSRLMSFISVKKPLLELSIAGIRKEAKEEETIQVIHPFVSKFQEISQSRSINIDYISKRSLSQIVDIFKRADMLDVDGNKTYNESMYHVGVDGWGIGYKNKIINVMFNIAKFRLYWARDIDLWKANKDATNESNAISLVKHLFAIYEAPEFLVKYWLEDPRNEVTNTYREWYVNLGKGENLRTQKGLPIPITKKIAHHIVKAPSSYSVNNAIRWGQIHNMGGNSTHVVTINNTPLGNDFSNDEFWLTVIKFFIDNPFLDVFQYRNVYDFINSQKFVNDIDRQLPPPQPNFSMKGREPNTLMLQVERWHQEMAARRPYRYYDTGSLRKYETWSSSGIKGLVHTTHHQKGSDTFHIVELLTSNELWEEGTAMHHCVGSYSSRCGSGQIAIFSLYVEKMGEDNKITKERMATIEVVVNERRIVQARKLCNAALNSEDLRIISMWKGKARISGI